MKKKDRLSYRERKKDRSRARGGRHLATKNGGTGRGVSLQLDKWTAEKKSLPQQLARAKQKKQQRSGIKRPPHERPRRKSKHKGGRQNFVVHTRWDSDLHLAARYIHARTRTLRLLSLLSKLWHRSGGFSEALNLPVHYLPPSPLPR
jgi:hypothetical protein